MENNVGITKLYCDFGSSSETADFWYATVLVDEDTNMVVTRIPGGRLGYLFGRLFYKKWRGGSEFVVGHGYGALQRMENIVSGKEPIPL